MYLYIGLTAAQFIFTGLQLYWHFKEKNKRVALEGKFEELNKNFAIVEQIITPFMAWVDEIQSHQKAVVKDAAERAEAFQKSQYANKPKPKRP